MFSENNQKNFLLVFCYNKKEEYDNFAIENIKQSYINTRNNYENIVEIMIEECINGFVHPRLSYNSE